VMPFCCGKRSAASASFPARNSPGRPTILGGAHKHAATYSSHRAPSTYSLGKERVSARLGRAGVIGYASDFSAPAASHLPASPFPRNEGILGQTPRRLIRQRRDVKSEVRRSNRPGSRGRIFGTRHNRRTLWQTSEMKKAARPIACTARFGDILNH
jgi:hypothetical protein